MVDLSRFLPKDRRKRLLEIGCAYGYFLEIADDYFDEVIGVDISRFALDQARARGLNVLEGDLWNVELNGTFDSVCLWDCIEHIADLESTFARISEITTPGSVIAITTGDIASRNARIRRGRWRMIDPPIHLHYFSDKTITKFLERYGFSIQSITPVGSYRSIDLALRVILEQRWNLPWAYKALSRIPGAHTSPYINLRDVMQVIAVRG